MRGAAPFLNGFEGPKDGQSSGDDAPGGKPTAKAVALTASHGDGLRASIVVPAGLTLAAFALVGVAVVRRRRLRTTD